MRALFVVDPLAGLDVAIDTSVGLMHAVQDKGGEVWVCEGRELGFVDGRPGARARRLVLAPSYPDLSAGPSCRWTVPDPWFTTDASTDVPLDEVDAVFVRLEPPVDGDYLAATHVLDLVDRDRVALVNDPAGLRAVSEHLLPLAFPDLAPPTLLSACPRAIADFTAAHGRAVVKPVDGFSGRGVFVLSAGDPNTASIIETSTDRGAHAVIVQPYLPEVEDGNKRVYVVDGEPVGATVRHPVPGDFRIVSPDDEAPVTARDREICARLAPTLRRHGLRMVGLDVIGPHLIEVNTTSPGALRKADALLGTTYCADLVHHIDLFPTWR
jgi:glutathione synthase